MNMHISGSETDTALKLIPGRYMLMSYRLLEFARVAKILVNFILRFHSGSNANSDQPMLKLKTHSGFDELFLN
jgi:hypothetical protein